MHDSFVLSQPLWDPFTQISAESFQTVSAPEIPHVFHLPGIAARKWLHWLETETWRCSGGREGDPRRASLTFQSPRQRGPGKVRSRVLKFRACPVRTAGVWARAFMGKWGVGVRKFQPPRIGVGWATRPAFRPIMPRDSSALPPLCLFSGCSSHLKTITSFATYWNLSHLKDFLRCLPWSQLADTSGYLASFGERLSLSPCVKG